MPTHIASTASEGADLIAASLTFRCMAKATSMMRAKAIAARLASTTGAAASPPGKLALRADLTAKLKSQLLLDRPLPPTPAPAHAVQPRLVREPNAILFDW